MTRVQRCRKTQLYLQGVITPHGGNVVKHYIFYVAYIRKYDAVYGQFI